MKILKIALKNLNSLKSEIRIDFQESPLGDTGLFAIVGDTGAGKTTILDALTLALYGKVHRNKNEAEVLSFGATDAYAEVEFFAKANTYRSKWTIHRARGKVDGNIITKRELAQLNPKTQEFDLLTTKIREIEEQTEAITGLDYQRFNKSVLLSQGDFAAFLKAGEKDRSNLLERITGTEIYSNISAAAFERFRLEEDKYTAIKKELAALQILDPETQKVIKKELKAFEKESGVLQKEVNHLKDQVQWVKKIEQLKDNEKEQQITLQQVQSSWTAAQPAFQQLVLHNKTLIFQKDLIQLANYEVAQTQLADEQVQLNLKIEQLTKQKELIFQTVQQKSEALQIAKKEQHQKEQLFEKVLALDVQLAERKEPITQSATQLTAVKNQQQQISTRLKKTQEQLQQHKQTKKTTTEWLINNKVLHQLREDIPKLELQHNDLKSLYQTVTTHQKDQEGILKNIASLQQQIAQFDQTLLSNKAEQQTVFQALANHYPSIELGTENQIVGVINEDIERLDERSKAIQSLVELNIEYQKLITELDQYEQEIAHLKANQTLVENRLLTALDQRDALQKRHQFKLKMYEREQLVANFEREREKLKEGEKCPLCLSTTHPFRTLTNYTPYVDETKEELLVVEQQLAVTQLECTKLLNRQNEINTAIQQYTGERDDEWGGERDLLLRQLQIQERKIAIIAPSLKDNEAYHTKGFLLKEILKKVETDLKDKRALRKMLLEFNEKQALHQKNQESWNKTHQQYQVQLTALQTNETNKQQSIQEINNKIEELKLKVSKMLTPYGYDLATTKFNQSLAALKEQFQLFENKNKEFLELEKGVALNEQQIEQLTQQLTQLQKQVQTQEQQHQTLTSAFQKIDTNRKELFGDKSAKEEKAKMLAQLQQLAGEESQLKQQLKEAEIALTSTQKLSQSTAATISKNQKALSSLQTKLQQKIKAQGFDTLEQLKIAHLSSEVVNQIESQKVQLQKQLTIQEQQLTTTQTTLNNLKKKQLTDLSIEKLLTQLNEKEHTFQELQQGIGRRKQQLDENEQKKSKSKTLVENMEVQKKEFDRWAKLQDLIGSRDGKKFRVFAQGLTLKRLTELANQHLKHLNGRYILNKPNDKDLELEIMDTYQADNVRSINTLSGGESFLVSLALALGLSDLAGRNTNIQSLFIDEGFGTLDESALDMAISTLENLQADGKTIGIISHIKELKERITTQIQIKKTSSGFSEVNII